MAHAVWFLIAAIVTYALWWIDEWQERRWRKEQSLRFMAAWLASSETFIQGVNRLVMATKAASITLSELSREE